MMIRLLLIVPLLWSVQCHAFSWAALWQRADQQAADYFHQERYDDIPDTAPDNWQGVASYRLNDYEKAIAAFSDAGSNVDTLYNLGNAYAQAGSFKKAITAYDRALTLAPDMEDAKFNKKLIEQLLAEQETQKQENQAMENQANWQENEPNRTNPGPNDESTTPMEQLSQSPGQAQSEARNQPKQDKTPVDGNEKQLSSSQIPMDEDVSDTASLNERSLPQTQAPISEQQQLLEQWLSKIPDDPSALLRNKFAYQYAQRSKRHERQQW